VRALAAFQYLLLRDLPLPRLIALSSLFVCAAQWGLLLHMISARQIYAGWGLMALMLYVFVAGAVVTLHALVFVPLCAVATLRSPANAKDMRMVLVALGSSLLTLPATALALALL
jgi:hypothetical protein